MVLQFSRNRQFTTCALRWDRVYWEPLRFTTVCITALKRTSFLPGREQYRKFPKYSDTQNICCNHSKIWTMWLYHRVMSPKDADGMANSVDPDQTAPLGAVWSGSALFAQAYLSENLGSLWYWWPGKIWDQPSHLCSLISLLCFFVHCQDKVYNTPV